jgi:hypothetical protein
MAMLQLAMVRRKRKKWDPGGHLDMYTSTRSLQFKQRDTGKIYARSNFFNFEDKIDFERIGNVMILEAQLSVRSKIE